MFQDWPAPLLTVAALLTSTAPVSPRAIPAQPKASVSSRPELHILSDTPLAEPLKYAVDLRWASDHSIYFALKRSGVVEHDLDKKGSPPKLMIPGEKAAGGFWLSYHVAVSSRYLIDGAPLFAMTWRTLDSAVRKEVGFEGISDLDVQGSQVAVIGSRRDAKGEFSPDGAIAWLGDLDRNFASPKPLLFDTRGAGAPNMAACGIVLLGATRFLADGTLIVVAGVQPGISRFDPKGKLLQTFDTVSLGIDTDCAGVDKELKTRIARDFRLRMAWVNERRIVDDILPLPAGPGLLIRSVRQGKVQWVLKVLQSDGKVAAYDVPVQSRTPLAHLKGDLRKGRLALLLWEYSEDGKPDGAPRPRLLLASLPDSSR